jgi:hypothetical protein
VIAALGNQVKSVKKACLAPDVSPGLDSLFSVLMLCRELTGTQLAEGDVQLRQGTEATMSLTLSSRRETDMSNI